MGCRVGIYFQKSPWICGRRGLLVAKMKQGDKVITKPRQDKETWTRTVSKEMAEGGLMDSRRMLGGGGGGC